MGVPKREWESHGTPTGSGTRHGSGSPMGVPKREWESHRESQRECSSIGSEIGSRESGGSLPAAVGLGGPGKNGWSSKKKVCLGSPFDRGGGGLPNPTEDTMRGEVSSGARRGTARNDQWESSGA